MTWCFSCRNPLILIALLGVLGSCAPKVDSYHSATPVFDPADFFNGRLNAWGIVTNWRGKVTQRFRMRAVASWQGDTGKMDEDLTYADGRKQQRHWRFIQTDAHHVTGTAPDVIGVARGVLSGNALHWIYTLRVTSKNGTHDVVFDDYLYRIDSRTAFSFVIIKKFGIKVGTLTMFFRKDLE